MPTKASTDDAPKQSPDQINIQEMRSLRERKYISKSQYVQH